MPIHQTRYASVYSHNSHFLTKNLTPGLKVYGENVITQKGIEYRVWNPRRSKLCALLHKGTKFFPFQKASKILYLGAGSGTTASHISDIAVDGIVYCIEFSPRVFRDLVKLCEKRKNMLPILADANKVESYNMYVKKVDIVYQDVAQRNQTDIFLKNIESFLKNDGFGIMMIKSRSIDVIARPKKIFKEVEKELKLKKLKVLEKVDLAPYEKDHASIVVKYTTFK